MPQVPETFEGSPTLPKPDYDKVPADAKAKTPGRKYASDVITSTAKRIEGAKNARAKTAPAKAGKKRRAGKR